MSIGAKQFSLLSNTLIFFQKHTHADCINKIFRLSPKYPMGAVRTVTEHVLQVLFISWCFIFAKRAQTRYAAGSHRLVGLFDVQPQIPETDVAKRSLE